MANGLLDVELLRDILPRSIDVDTRYQNEINLFCHTRRSAIQSVSGLLSILDMHRERSVYKLGQTRVDEITRQGEKLLASLRAELRWALGLPSADLHMKPAKGIT